MPGSPCECHVINENTKNGIGYHIEKCCDPGEPWNSSKYYKIHFQRQKRVGGSTLESYVTDGMQSVLPGLAHVEISTNNKGGDSVYSDSENSDSQDSIDHEESQRAGFLCHRNSFCGQVPDTSTRTANLICIARLACLKCFALCLRSGSKWICDVSREVASIWPMSLRFAFLSSMDG